MVVEGVLKAFPAVFSPLFSHRKWEFVMLLFVSPSHSVYGEVSRAFDIFLHRISRNPPLLSLFKTGSTVHQRVLYLSLRRFRGFSGFFYFAEDCTVSLGFSCKLCLNVFDEYYIRRVSLLYAVCLFVYYLYHSSTV